jgi:hypothetical protein
VHSPSSSPGEEAARQWAYASEVLEQERSEEQEGRKLPIYCDRWMWSIWDICAGKLLKTHAGVLVHPVTKKQMIRARCRKCGKRYKFKHPLAWPLHYRRGE